jgi:hypothetical protein
MRRVNSDYSKQPMLRGGRRRQSRVALVLVATLAVLLDGASGGAPRRPGWQAPKRHEPQQPKQQQQQQRRPKTPVPAQPAKYRQQAPYQPPAPPPGAPPKFVGSFGKQHAVGLHTPTSVSPDPLVSLEKPGGCILVQWGSFFEICRWGVERYRVTLGERPADMMLVRAVLLVNIVALLPADGTSAQPDTLVVVLCLAASSHAAARLRPRISLDHREGQRQACADTPPNVR